MSTTVVTNGINGYGGSMDARLDDRYALSVLAEPQRARIYDYLAAAGGSPSRQEVSAELGIGRTLVAFHVDKLEHAGLIEPAEAGRAVAGTPGRPPRRYRVTHEEIAASVPPRRYELLAEVLVQAAGDQAAGEPLRDAAIRAGRRRGRALADDVADRTDQLPGARLIDLLTRLGYEPRDDEGGVVLTNCPFRRLRVMDTELVCSVNVALADGYLEGLRSALTARLRPCPDSCCVVLEPSA